MSCKLEVIEQQLREQGWRVTPQRQLLLEALHAAPGHVDAETLWRRVTERFPSVSLSTIYRSLEALRDLGAATETDLGHGRVEYHLASHGDHHHLLCTRCGSCSELPSAALAPLKRQLLDRYGFDMGVNHVAFRGVCARCAQRSTTDPSQADGA